MTWENLNSFILLCAYLVPDMPGVAPWGKWELVGQMATGLLGIVAGGCVLAMALHDARRRGGWLL